MSTPLHTCWASTDDWQPGFVILGANVKAIPTPPPQSPVIIGADGSWGAHKWTVYPQLHHRDFLYLAWIPLCQSNTSVPSSIHTPVDKSMWQAHPDQPNTHVITPALLDKLSKEWESAKALLQDLFKTFSSDPSFTSVRYPKEAYIRELAALTQLEKDFGAWQDFIEVFQNFQRSLSELLAFLDWWRDIRTGNKFRSPIRAPMRGAIFEDARLYENYVHYPLHSLDHWYYLLLVRDFVMELETAAQGYVNPLDLFDPTKSFKHKLDKMENRKNNEGKAKKAKMIFTSLATSPNSQELRCLTDAGVVPDWFPGIQEVWKHAMNHVSHLDLAAQESLCCFVLPPIHLFWGGEPQNQHIYYHHYLSLFNEIKNWPECDLPALATQEWRSILGNTYWKKQWPKPNGNNPLMFDPDIFWKYGGSLLFGKQQSAKVTVGCYNPTSQLACRCHVQLSMADDTDFRQVVLYYLNSFHVYVEIKEMMWDLSGGSCVNPDFFCNKKVWRSWVWAVCDLVADWDGFDCWNWGHFSNVRNMGINKLLGPDLQKFTIYLLTFYIHTFVQRLGYYPSPLLLCPPTFTGHTCADH
ncbi:hypothetical protein V8E53_000003 [Lactarius tabidus]